MSVAELKAEIARLEALKATQDAELAALKAAKVRTFDIRIGEKGGVSVYGAGRFPFTGYVEQWEFILSHAADITAFMEANKANLKAKGQKDYVRPVAA